MKSRILIIGAVMIGVIVMLFWLLSNDDSKSKKKFEKTFSVSASSSKPYDNKFFYDQIKKYAAEGFEETKISIEDLGLANYETQNNTYVVVSPYFYPTKKDIHDLKEFANIGNTVFISAYEISEQFIDSLYFTPRNDEFKVRFPPSLSNYRWRINWIENDSTTSFTYPGHRPTTVVLDSVYLLSNNLVTALDTLITDEYNNIQMLEATCGSGKIIVSNNPILLSNYFLLHRNNYEFFNKIAQKIDLNSNYILWDDFYKTQKKKRNPFERRQNEVLKVIFENPPLTWAFYTFWAGIILFILIYFRRVQRVVPIRQSLKNNSEEYINVVSGLYWNQQSHRSIADKIIGQFFEYLMTHHQINATETDLLKISQKTDRNLEKIKEIFDEIQLVKSEEEINKQSLISLYQKINAFYQDSTHK